MQGDDMRFNPKARLDTSRVRDGGGSGGSGGGGISLGGGGIGLPHIAGGGGVIGVIIAVIVILIQLHGGGSGGLDTSAFTGGSVGIVDPGQQFDYSTCKTGDDANDHPECELVAVENSLTDYWAHQPQLAASFSPEKAIDVFHGQTQTGGCGTADTGVGPFYCSGDQIIYLDPAFYTTVFKQLGGDATTFVQAYVIAHEYGHHIQDLLGTMSKVRTQQGQNSDSVRLELQADCYAGMWTAAASGTTDGTEPIISELTQQDISEGLTAAKIVGDDYIEQTMGGRVDPGSWTHGSSAERQAWFTAGMRAGNDIRGCDTFSAKDLTKPASIG
jgi:uncharacterized protein